MPDVMLFGEGWKGEKRSVSVAAPGDYISYLSKTDFTQNQLEIVAPGPVRFNQGFRVSTFRSQSGQAYLIAVSGDRPSDEWVEQAVASHQPAPLEG
ncbi:hypothetical protein HA42_17595 [Pantoea deleyi]|nr:hypothetical protein HA42_17595 [Pantoea deleyi]